MAITNLAAAAAVGAVVVDIWNMYVAWGSFILALALVAQASGNIQAARV